MIQYISESFPDAAIAGWTGPGWYFWDEIQTHCYGPYTTEWQARYNAFDYGKKLHGKA